FLRQGHPDHMSAQDLSTTATISAAPAFTLSISPMGWKLISFAIFFGIWEIAGRIPISLAFPPFSEVAVALFNLIVSGELIAAYGRTLPPLLIGLAITGVVGVAF